jgi:hypothetical protein
MERKPFPPVMSSAARATDLKARPRWEMSGRRVLQPGPWYAGSQTKLPLTRPRRSPRAPSPWRRACQILGNLARSPTRRRGLSVVRGPRRAGAAPRRRAQGLVVDNVYVSVLP